jgi:hydroxymethylbilane synthase
MPLRLGSRGSALAIVQAELAVAALAARGIESTVVPVVTTGDRRRAAPDKEKWVKELELALLAGEIDLAVHSAKDVPGELAEGTEIVAVPPREDPRDVLIGELGGPPARVGTASLRRAAQIAAWRDDVEVVSLRGNVDTRLRKLADGEVDAIVLAAAGLRRLGRMQGMQLDAPVFVPAAGQGALALQARTGDAAAREAVAPIASERSLACLSAERAAVRVLGASCHTPVGVHCDGHRTRGFVGAVDGSSWVLDEVEGLDGERLAERMLAAGARELLGG